MRSVENMLHLPSLGNPSAVADGHGIVCKQKKGRKSRPKVKTGCISCKQRRIKCDEKRPSCTQCVRSRKKCGGYPPPPRANIFEAKKIAPKPPSRTDLIPVPAVPIIAINPHMQSMVSHSIITMPVLSQARALTPPETPKYGSLTLHRPSTFLFDSSDAQYFQLFRDYTASELTGFFDSSFWTTRVLQECHSEDSIRHAVVALGALYKTLEKITETPPSSPSSSDYSDNASQHWTVAFKHYSLAIKAVLYSSSKNQKRMSLMASVLLASFDSFIGDHKHTIKHIQHGLSLLETLRAEYHDEGYAKHEEPVEQDLVQMFTRLAIQAKSYDLAFHFPQPYVIRLTPTAGTSTQASWFSDGGPSVSEPQVLVPEVFTSLHDARLAWDTILEKTMRFTERMLACVQMMPMNILPQSFRQDGREFDEKIDAWSRAFDPILASRMSPAKSTQEKTATAVLKMNQIMGSVLFKMTFSPSESEFDKFLSCFQDIVDLAVEVIGDEERRAAARRCPHPAFCTHQSAHQDIFGGEYTARHIKPSFSADLGIIPPLYVVATKCRHTLTRHQAIQLLRTSARREGMWDSELCAQIGDWIANVEEEDGVVDSARPGSRSTEASRWSVSSPGSVSADSSGFGDDALLGPGGNARWGGRGESVPLSPSSHTRVESVPVPDEKRIMVRAVEFDLQKRVAHMECGNRRLRPGMSDSQSRTATLRW